VTLLNLRTRLKLAGQLLRNDWNSEIKKFFAGDDSAADDATFNRLNSINTMMSSAQFAAVRVLNETIGSLPIMTYIKTANGREPTTKNNIYQIFHEAPNEELTCQGLKEAGMMSLNLGGNAFFQKIKNKYGDIIGVEHIDYSKVVIERNRITKKLEYKIENKTYTRNDIFHIPAFSYDGVCGLTPLTQCASTILLGVQYEEYNKNFYKNGAFTSGTVEFPNKFSDVAFERFKKDFESNYRGLMNAGKPIILEEGGKFNPMKMTQADTQFMEARRFQLEEVARIYRVPLTLLQDFGRATWNNMEQQQLFFVMFTILPLVKRWEENIKTQIMTPEQRTEGIYVEFQLNNLLRGDAKTRAELYASGRQNGWLSVNDIRRLENLNPIAGGDTYIQPLNYININQADDYYAAHMEKSSGSAQTKAIANEIYNILERKGKEGLDA
jgi:HK97 family phage portal protein